jgi:membrane-bound metal-dependent hydrolase YbcI (DUF457 family)
MAQAGIHGFVGLIVAQRMPNPKRFRLGFILGSVLPDADILVAGPAMLIGLSADDFHRTFSHSVFTAAGVAGAFFLIGRLRKSHDWARMGLGLSLGMTAHMLVDFLLWFRGLQIVWPIPWQASIWCGMDELPDWWIKVDLSGEFACFAVFFAVLSSLARRRQMNDGYLLPLWRWTIAESSLFAVFVALALVPGATLMVFRICWWLAYIPSLGIMIYVIIRMRGSINSMAVPRS